MSNFKLEAGAGDMFTNVAREAKRISHQRKELVEFDFNGVTCIVEGRMDNGNNKPDTDLNLLYRDYCNAHMMGWETVGPNCVPIYDKKTKKAIEKKEAESKAKRERYREELAQKTRRKTESLKEKLEGVEMEFKDKELWESGLAKNQDPYGGGIYTYAERWAKLMQFEMDKFQTSVPDIAEKASQDADIDGITGFMYGAAVNVLSHTWKYGEDLRKWHNKDYGHEGDGVVNPAVLTLGKKEE